MKTTKQQKRKTIEPSKKQNVFVGSAGVKKSTNRTGGRHQETAVGCKYILAEDDPGILPFSAAQEVGQQLPRRYTFARETTKEIPKLEQKIGIHPSEKIKLQLFPINEGTRKELEKNGYNPFLELTLRARKKISSVLKHLNSKWGSSSIALGDPMLFPYNAELEKLSTYKRWTLNDSGISAGDIYVALESPAVFRLRYGWFSNIEPKPIALPSRSTHLGDCFQSEGLQNVCNKISDLTDCRKEKLPITSEDFKPISTISEAKTISGSEAADAVVTNNEHIGIPVDYVDDEVKTGNDVAQSFLPWNDSLTDLSIGGLLSEGSKLNLQPVQLFSSDISIGGLLSEASLQGRINIHEPKSGLQPTMDKGLVQPSVPWDDSLTNLSIGGLLSEASLQGKVDCCDPKSNGSKLGLQSTSFISDSLDAFIAGQLNSQPQESKPPSHVSHSSILDAEETCHAFSFRKLSSSGNNAVRVVGSAISRDHNHDGSSKSFGFSNFAELNGQGELAQDPPLQESETGLLTHLGVNNDDSGIGLAGIKWTESLGPFDISLPTSRQITSADSVSISKSVR